jgi:hypothetical protein
VDGFPVIAGLAAGVGFFVLLTVVVDSSISPDVSQEELWERQNTATAIAMSLPEVQALTNNATNIEVKYRWLALDRDRVTVTVTAAGPREYLPLYNDSGVVFTHIHFPLDVWIIDIKMDFQLLKEAIGFVLTESENKMLTVDTDRKTNSVLSVQVDPLPDRTVTVKFTEKQRKAIDLVLSDATVQELAAEHPYFVQQIRPGVGGPGCSDPEGCILVGLGLMSEPRLGVHTAIIVDISAGKVVNVSPPLSEQ